MQTGLPTLEILNVGASAKVQKTPPGANAAAKDAASEQLAGFMEIMSALLALPQEQWKQSLAGLDVMSADGGSAALPCMAENCGKNMPPADLLKLIMNMKGAVLQQLRSAKADGRPQPLLDMAEALMEDPRLAAAGSLEAGEDRLAQGADPGNAFTRFENGIQDGLPIAPEASAESRLSGGGDPGTGKGGNPMIIEAMLDGGDNAPAADDEEASKTSRDPSPVKDFLFKTSDTRTEGASIPETDKTNPSLTAGMTKMPAQEGIADEKGQGVDKTHPDMSADTLKNQGVNAQPAADGGKIEEHLVQKADTPAGGQQGILWRTEARQDSNGLSIAGSEEAMPQEKAEPSDVIRQIVQRMSMHTNGTQSKMVIRLKPEFLGNVHMQVLTENHQVTVRMMADSALVKDIVEQNLPHLQAELQHHGLEIQKFDVFVANDDHGSRGGQEQSGFRDAMNRKQSRSGGEKSRHQRGKISFNTGKGKKIVQKDPGEIDYFA